jgi:NAD(P)-dependent dehydrogenase (short-subunit alcohol dehydrogenase family)
MLLSSSTSFITGGGSGLGAACARRFVADGGNVLIADVQEDVSQKLVAELGAQARFVRTDVTDEAAVTQALAAAVDAFGGVHVVINCAGIGGAERVAGRDGPHRLDSFAAVIGVNLIGTFNVIRLAAAVMSANEPNAEGERGVVINTASIAAFDGQIGQAAYSASKGGIVSMTLPIARELARFGIRVVTIAPGIFDTPLLAGLPEAARQSLGEQVPFPSRLGDPAEYGALVAHIVENPMLNGETIRLDGSLRMGPK